MEQFWKFSEPYGKIGTWVFQDTLEKSPILDFFKVLRYFEHYGIFPVFLMSFCTLGQLCTTGTFLSILKNLKFFAQFFRIFVAFSHCINFLDFVAKGSSFHGLVKITWMKFMELKTWCCCIPLVLFWHTSSI